MWDLIVSVPDHCLSFYFEIDTVSPNSLYAFSLELIDFVIFETWDNA